jgi:tetratricopeptide (TPR) repeat protein
MPSVAVLTLALFGVYAAGACPTTYVGESGELATAVFDGSASGPPLYVWLGKLWALALPVGTQAWRLSLFSAACAALSCGLLYRLCRQLQARPLAALTAALLLAFLPSFWGEATVQRTATLDMLLLVLATSAAVRWHARPKGIGALTLAFFLCGLDAGSRAFLPLNALGLALFAFAAERSLRRQPARLLLAASVSLPGVLSYLYGWRALLHRRPVSTWIERPGDLMVVAYEYGRGLAAEFAWAGAALAAIGLVAASRRRRLALLPLFVMITNFGLLVGTGSYDALFVEHRSWLPSYLMAAWLAGLGCHVLLAAVPRSLRLVPLALPVLLFVTGWREYDRSGYEIAARYGQAILRSLPADAHLAADDLLRPTLRSLQEVERMRPDIRLVEAKAAVRPLYLTRHPDLEGPPSDIVPMGIVLRAGVPAPAVIPFTALPGEGDPWVPKDPQTQALIGRFHFLLGLTFEDRDWLRARREMASAAAAAANDAGLFYDLGAVLTRNGLLEEAREHFARSANIDPRHQPVMGRPLAVARMAEVDAERIRVDGVERALASDPELRAVGADPVARHQRLAELFERRGETVAARGHRRRALERAAGLP